MNVKEDILTEFELRCKRQIPRSPRTRLNVEKQGEGREDLMKMEIIFWIWFNDIFNEDFMISNMILLLTEVTC